MAKFRRAHEGRSRGKGGTMVRLFIIGLIFALIFIGLNYLSMDLFQNTKNKEEEIPLESENRFYLPLSSTGKIIHHHFFSLSYADDHRQPEWVAYELRRSQLELSSVGLAGDYRVDAAVGNATTTPEDYRSSGYDKGHLVSSGDRVFSEAAMSETFLMSNISPMDRGFNRGIWRELEEMTREWAMENGHLYIIVGPVFNNIKGKIGENGITIPGAFYKVLLDYTPPEVKAIAFIIPNEISSRPLMEYAVTVDEVENTTGIDFFGELLTADIEDEIEHGVNKELWPVNEQKYRLRVDEWNKE